jgi:alpha-glucuronidase
VAEKFGSLEKCPENLLLWFHHVSWDHTMDSGRTLWEELCHKYYTGVDSVRWMQQTWNALEGMIDQERFEQVKTFLKIQEKEAVWWRNACVLYFQTFSNQPIPEGLQKPEKSLEYYRSIEKRYVPGI